MSYTPSEAAVEVVARALYGAMYDGDFAEESPRARVKFRRYAEAALVAFMGATVPAEPCASGFCYGTGKMPRIPGHPDAGVGDLPCSDCPSPRSLPVVECEAAGLLERKGAIPPYYDGVLDVDVPAEPLFREAAPSTGSPT